MNIDDVWCIGDRIEDEDGNRYRIIDIRGPDLDGDYQYEVVNVDDHREVFWTFGFEYERVAN